jgi:hypothetical protein
MHKRNYVEEKARYWKPGDPLTERDRLILQPLLKRAKELGRSPTRSEVRDINHIKHRFRIWENALCAAGLPSLRNLEQQKLRDEAKQKQRSRQDEP